MKTLLELYRIPSKSGQEKKMKKYVRKYLRDLNLNPVTDSYGNVYCTKGESETYPCIVAHLDEVHNHSSKYNVGVSGNRIIYGYDPLTLAQEGIGADDKNGIWIALKMIEELDACKIAFFVGEEVGCVGSNKADMSFFDDCRFVLQCDRKGNSDFITDAAGTELSSDEWIKRIPLKDFGYHTELGSVTDVMELKEKGLKVCAANISCGYYHPHTSSEVTNMDDLNNCLELVRWICNNITDVCPHTFMGYDTMYSEPGTYWDVTHRIYDQMKDWGADSIDIDSIRYEFEYQGIKVNESMLYDAYEEAYQMLEEEMMYETDHFDEYEDLSIQMA